jgi:hypothetical protein
MTYTDENGRLYVVAEDGTETAVFAKLSGGVLHCMVRAIDEDTFNAVGLSVGLLSYENPTQPEVLDEEGNVVTAAVEASGAIVPSAGNTVTRIGPHVITPGTYDDEGVELTAPVVDSRYHVNFWLGADVVARGAWEPWIVQWMASDLPGTPNKDESSLAMNGIELIDPLTITSPSNVLL